MFVLPVGPYAPVAPVKPVAPVTRKPRTSERTSEDKHAASHPVQTATAMASHSTQAALDDMKLGG